jgi:hypothetical protein
MTMHQLRVTLDDYGPRPFKLVIVHDIDGDDYDPKNYTVGSLVWDAWNMVWPQVSKMLDNTVLREDQRLLVTFDNTYVADEAPSTVTEDLFTASWVAQHDEPLMAVT